ncbi:MAG: hypothetical protein K0R00_3201 [Herbinix sp.]|jgi:hypothetical protein|nr:hypothetical protein [Herbinix sp.]
MATDLKRFTISVTPEIEAKLDLAKKEYFYKNTQNEMIRSLIVKGLNSLKNNSESESSSHHRSA